MKTSLIILMTLVLTSCHVNNDSTYNVRIQLYGAYEKANSASLEELKITRFSHIGEITVNGQRYYVIDLRTAIKGMMSPRGNNAILLYSKDLQFVEKVPYSTAVPLWCEGSRVYLWGAESREGMYGNVWEFKDGFKEAKRKLIEIPAYGSYKSEETLKKKYEE